MDKLFLPDLVTSIELSGESWEFDLFGVFWDGKDYWTATDSGCSCPTPWEAHRDRSRFHGPFTVEQARVRLDVAAINAPASKEGWFVDQYRSSREDLINHGLLILGAGKLDRVEFDPIGSGSFIDGSDAA